MKKLSSLFFAFYLTISPCFAWGLAGHRAIAIIAQDRLSDQALAKVHEILGDDIDLVDVVYWADEIKFAEPNTRDWHYIDIPISEDVSLDEISKYCKNSECITDKIETAIDILRGDSTELEKKQRALKFLVHLVGDIHQPLHCADNGDRGGNGTIVRFEGRKMNLHSLWDHVIEKQETHKSQELVDEITRHTTEQIVWQEGTVEGWALESYLIARDKIYTPLHTTAVLPDSYRAEMKPIAEIQILKAGVRLAHLLNETLGE